MGIFPQMRTTLDQLTFKCKLSVINKAQISSFYSFPALTDVCQSLAIDNRKTVCV